MAESGSRKPVLIVSAIALLLVLVAGAIYAIWRNQYFANAANVELVSEVPGYRLVVFNRRQLNLLIDELKLYDGPLYDKKSHTFVDGISKLRIVLTDQISHDTPTVWNMNGSQVVALDGTYQISGDILEVRIYITDEMNYLSNFSTRNEGFNTELIQSIYYTRPLQTTDGVNFSPLDRKKVTEVTSNVGRITYDTNGVISKTKTIVNPFSFFWLDFLNYPILLLKQ